MSMEFTIDPFFPCRWFGALKESGYEIEFLSYTEWRRRFLKAGADSTALAPVAPIFTGIDP